MSMLRIGYGLLLSTLITGCVTRAADKDTPFNPANGRAVIVSGVLCLKEGNGACEVQMAPRVRASADVVQVAQYNKLTYNVFIVKPGFYIVRFLHAYGRTLCTTNPQSSDKDVTFGIEIKPGEMIYTGDIIAKLGDKCPVDELAITANLKRAQAELAKYPGIQGQLEYRPWFTKPPTLAPDTSTPPPNPSVAPIQPLPAPPPSKS